MDKRTKEIRTILTGFLARDAQSGYLTAAHGLRELRNMDFFPGTDAARFLGVHVTKRQYYAQGKAQNAWQECRQLFATGAPVFLTTAPDALASFYRPLWGKPTVITMDRKDQQFLLSLYTARGLLARRRMERLLKKIVLCCRRACKRPPSAWRRRARSRWNRQRRRKEKPKRRQKRKPKGRRKRNLKKRRKRNPKRRLTGKRSADGAVCGKNGESDLNVGGNPQGNL